MGLDCFQEIVGAGGVVTAAGIRSAEGLDDRADEELVGANAQTDEGLHSYSRQILSRLATLIQSCSSSSRVASEARQRAMVTTIC